MVCMDHALELSYIPIHVPSRPERTRLQQIGVKKAQEAAAKTHRMMTEGKRLTLLEILKSPPDDFDGSNGKLAKYMGCSVRTAIRLLKGLESDRKIRVNRFTMKTPKGFYVERSIQVLRQEIH